MMSLFNRKKYVIKLVDKKCLPKFILSYLLNKNSYIIFSIFFGAKPKHRQPCEISINRICIRSIDFLSIKYDTILCTLLG